MLCVCHTTPTEKLLCLHVFRQAGPSQRVDCLAPKWETKLSVFPRTQLLGSDPQVTNLLGRNRLQL